MDPIFFILCYCYSLLGCLLLRLVFRSDFILFFYSSFFTYISFRLTFIIKQIYVFEYKMNVINMAKKNIESNRKKKIQLTLTKYNCIAFGV